MATEVFIDEPGGFLHAVTLPTIPVPGDRVTYQRWSETPETRRVLWRRIEASTANGPARIVIGVEDTRDIDIESLFGP